jgi:hypothetical protein
MKCPPLSTHLVIADDPRLAAQASCALAVPGAYLPVIDGPRMERSDVPAEVARRNNAAARAKAAHIIAAGLSDDSFTALATGFRPKLLPKMQRIYAASELPAVRSLQEPPIAWGRDRIGIGLLKALRQQRSIVFADSPSPDEVVPPKSDHLVICEAGNDLAQVIAANYAYALRAGLRVIPAVNEQAAEDLLENLYSSDEQRERAQSETLAVVKARLRELCEPVSLPPNGSVTFFTGRLPYGFAFPEAPSTHLFNYPDLGIAVINGFSAEQAGTAGVSVSVLVDPGTTPAPEIDAAEELLGKRGSFVRTLKGAGATVRRVTEMVEWFPYDLLLIATHCQDVSGHRWTYEYTDSEGIDRKLVVDIAIGLERTNDPKMLRVTQFIRFVSLDGVDWNDPVKKEQAYVGAAITDYMARTRGSPGNEMKPTLKELVPRVVGSAVLHMHDHNYIPLPRPLADEGTPIIINNACCSWHRLAQTFVFCNARAYIGTLISISTSEAHDVVVKMLGKHCAKPLPHALWSSQRDVYRDDPRRPYVAMGIYPQSLRTERHDVPKRLWSRLKGTLASWRKTLEGINPLEVEKRKMVEETVRFYEREADDFSKRWPNRT